MITLIDNTEALKKRKGSQNAIVRTRGYYTPNDGGDGEYFWDDASTAIDDGGSVFKVKDVTTGRWIARFKNNLVNAKQFGAKGDGVENDLNFLNPAARFCGLANRSLTLFIPNGVYRIENQWLIGKDLVPVEEELITYFYTKAPSYDYTGEENWRPFRIVGSYDTVIHADFSSLTLKHAIYWGIRPNRGTVDRDEFMGEISNLKIVGQGSYSGTTEETFWSWQTEKNQAGLAIVATQDMTLTNLYFKNMQRGLCLNGAYNLILNHFVANSVQYAYAEIGSNTGTRNSTHVSHYELAYELNSTLVIWNGMWAEGPNKVLRIKSANNTTINGFYSEAHERLLTDESYVVDIGANASDPDYEPDGTTGITFNGFFLPAMYTDESYANGLQLRDGARQITITGGLVTANIHLANNANRLVFVNSNHRAGALTLGAGVTNKIFHLGSNPAFIDVTTDQVYRSADHLDLRPASTKNVRIFGVPTGGSPVAQANQYGFSAGTAITDPNTKFQVAGLQRYNGARIFGSSNEYISDWFNINLTGTQDTLYFNLGNYTGFASNRLTFELELDSGYVTSSPMSLGKLIKRFTALVSSNGVGVTNQTNEIIADYGTMSSVFAIGDVEAAGSGVIRIPVKLLAAVTGAEKRAHIRLKFYTWNGVNIQFVAPSIAAATTGTYGVKQERVYKVVRRAIFSGDGTTVSFNIPHGLGSTPMAVVTSASTDAAGISYITENGTNITVHYDVAPPTGTDNVILNWIANL